MDAKRQLRQRVHQQIRAFLQRDEADRHIIETVMTLPEWQSSGRIAFTYPIGLEVNTVPLIEAALQAGKIVCLPKTTETGLTFHDIKRLDELVSTGTMGLVEPTTPETNETIDLCIVPGRVFDRRGYRIGWGGGYYDRFLESYEGQTLSVAYAIQVTSEVPTEAHDMPVEKIVTEREIILCSESSS